MVKVSIEEIQIREYKQTDSIKGMTDLLHRSYKFLADMGLKYLATHQSEETTLERISKGVCFVAEYKHTIIGLINYYPGNDFPEVTLQSPWMGQFAVEPTLQKNGIGRKMIEHVELYAKEKGDKTIALDTAEPAKHLIDWYTRLGYKFHSFVNWDITNYRSVILIKDLLL